VLGTGNLHAQQDGVNANNFVRSTIGVTSGKWYFELMLESDTFPGSSVFGVVNGSASVNSGIGSSVNGWGFNSSNGWKSTNGGNSAYGSAWSGSANNRIGVKLDMDAGTVEFGQDQNNQPMTFYGVAFTGLTGTIYAAAGGGGQVFCMANFGASALAHSPPAGFNAGLYTP
jgi:hypothetical protein